MAKKIKSGRIRFIVQIIFFVIVTLIAVSHSLEEAGINIPFLPSASLHAVCPFGGVVSIYEFFVSGTFVKQIHESSFILMFIVLGLAILLLKDKVSDDVFIELQKIGIDISEFKQSSFLIDEEHELTEELLVLSNTTFGDLESMGISEDEIKNILGIPPGKSGESLRNFCTANDLEFSEIKVKLPDCS